MSYLAYNTILRAAAPPLALYLRFSRRNALLARFNPPLPQALPASPIWVQACSVGEVQAAKALLRELRRRFPGTPLLLTTSTTRGFEAAQQGLNGLAHLAWFPFDTPRATTRFVRRLDPRALLLIETELWPNAVRACRRLDVPVLVLNGRLSDDSSAGYRRFRRFYGKVAAQLDAVAAQSGEHAERFRQLGVPHERIEVTGNAKFDAVSSEPDAAQRRRLMRLLNLGPQHTVVVFGSTHAGEEALAAECLKAWREQFPQLRLVIAPRHLERLDEILPLFDCPVLHRSELDKGRLPAGEQVIVLDTYGELAGFYGIATAAIVGGSFAPGVGGHNPLEPAALGIPTLFGPHMENFREVSKLLLEARSAVQVECAAALCEQAAALLEDVPARRQLGTRGRRVVLANQGAVARSVDLVARVLARQEAQPA